MADQFALWIRTRLTPQDFEALKDAFRKAGYSLTHPAYNTGILLDGEGEQVQTPEDEIAELVTGHSGLVTFEWWLNSDEDIVCSAGPVPGHDRLQELWFYLDGVDQDVRVRVAEALLGLVHAHPERTRALVVDYRGSTVEFDWRSYLIEGGRPPAVQPDILITSSAAQGSPND